MRVARFSPPLYDLNYARNRLLVQQHGMHLIRLLSNQYCLSARRSANFTFLLDMWHFCQLQRLFRVVTGTEPYEAPPIRATAAEVDKLGLFGPSRTVQLYSQQSFENRAKQPLKASILTEVRLLLQIAADERAVFCYENTDGCYFLERVEPKLEALEKYIRMYATQRNFLRFLEISTLAPAQKHVYELVACFPYLIYHQEMDQLLCNRQVLFLINKDGVFDARSDVYKANESKEYVSAMLREHQYQRDRLAAKNNAADNTVDEEASLMQLGQFAYPGHFGQSGLNGQTIGPMVDYMVADSANNSFVDYSTETAPAPATVLKKDPQRTFAVNLPSIFSNGLVNSSSINLARKLMTAYQSGVFGAGQQGNLNQSNQPNNSQSAYSYTMQQIHFEPSYIAHFEPSYATQNDAANSRQRALMQQQAKNNCSSSHAGSCRTSTSVFYEISGQIPARSPYSRPQSLARLPSIYPFYSPQLLYKQKIACQRPGCYPSLAEASQHKNAEGEKRPEDASLVVCGDFEHLSFAEHGLQGAYCYCASLRRLELGNNRISGESLRISACARLEYLNLENNRLGSIDLSNFSYLYVLNLAGNPITAIDVSRNGRLRQLVLNRTEVAELDLHACCELVKLSCYRSPLRGLYLSVCMKDLRTIDVNNTLLSEICIPALPALEFVYLYGIAGLSSSSVKLGAGVRAFWRGAFE